MLAGMLAALLAPLLAPWASRLRVAPAAWRRVSSSSVLRATQRASGFFLRLCGRLVPRWAGTRLAACSQTVRAIPTAVGSRTGWPIRLAAGFHAAYAARLERLIEAESGRFVLWLPVFMGAGVLTYFSLRVEPPLWAGAAAAAPASRAAGLAGRWRPARALLLCLAAAAVGFSASQFAMARAPPMDTLPRTATVLTGIVRGVEALPEGRRLTLEDVRLDGADHPLSRHLHVRLRANDATELGAGDTIRVRALVRPPAPPAYPGGWDLQRDAFFAGLGGGGYALGTAERLARTAPGGVHRIVQALREAIARQVAAAVPGAAGTVCITLLTGESRGIPEGEHDAFRASGLAHLLAVAGLHIGIVMGWTMLLARTGFAASEHASLFWPTKRLAAVAALAAGGGYMVLTGMHVPIVRSFAMACLVTVAVLAGRQAVSLRGLALAATVLILLEPQEVPGVSFQMSFSAVLALISGYELLRPWLRALDGSAWYRRLAVHVACLALTSALAGTFSMPYGAYHFGRIQVYFVISNMAAVPLTALWVMPAGLVGLLLMPFGLDWLAFVPMGWGAEAILWVARTATALPASTLDVPHMPAWGLGAVSLGIAWLGLWRSRIRLAGLVAISVGVLSPAWDRPPDLLVSADARLIAVRTPAGVFMQSTGGSQRFTRDSWLQYWGGGAALPMPGSGEAADGAVACARDACLLRPRPGVPAALLARGGVGEWCRSVGIVVSAEPARGLCPRPWPALVDRFTVWRQGAAAIWLQPHGRARVLTDREARGTRPWVPPPPEPRSKAAPAGLPPAARDGPGGG